MPSPGYQLKSRCQIHGGRIDEHKRFNGIEVEIWENLHIASLEYLNVPFVETMLFEVIPEDFEWNRWDADHRFIHLYTPKEMFSMSTRTDVSLSYVLRVAGLAFALR
jgi:hypothetical protein